MIAWVHWKYMSTPPVNAAPKVMLGSALVPEAVILIGQG